MYVNSGLVPSFPPPIPCVPQKPLPTLAHSLEGFPSWLFIPPGLFTSHSPPTLLVRVTEGGLGCLAEAEKGVGGVQGCLGKEWGVGGFLGCVAVETGPMEVVIRISACRLPQES